MAKECRIQRLQRLPGITLSEPSYLFFVLVLLELFKSRLLTEGQLFDLCEKGALLTSHQQPSPPSRRSTKASSTSPSNP